MNKDIIRHANVDMNVGLQQTRIRYRIKKIKKKGYFVVFELCAQYRTFCAQQRSQHKNGTKEMKLLCETYVVDREATQCAFDMRNNMYTYESDEVEIRM